MMEHSPDVESADQHDAGRVTPLEQLVVDQAEREAFARLVPHRCRHLPMVNGCADCFEGLVVEVKRLSEEVHAVRNQANTLTLKLRLARVSPT